MGTVNRTNTPRVLLVDDDPSVLMTVGLLLEHEGSMHVAGTASDANSAIEQTRKLKPDLVLMDLKLPGKSGLEAIRELQPLRPQIKILVYSGYPGAAEEALAAGAHGFIAKPSPANQLVDAMRVVTDGGICFDEQTWSLIQWRLVLRNPEQGPSLNEEERALASLLAQGLTSKEIADELGKTVRRVHKVRSRLMNKFGVRNAAALASKLALPRSERL